MSRLRLPAVVIAAALLLFLPAGTARAESIGCAVYLGVKDYGESSVNSKTKENFEYNFFVDGTVKTWLVDNGEPSDDSTWTYDIQNKLEEGRLYRLEVNDSTVTSAELIASDDDRVVCGIIGRVASKSIAINSKVYRIASGTKTWRVAWRAGGAKVEEDVAISGKTVRAVLNSKGRITAMYLMPVAKSVLQPVKYTPGRKTLKNFLAAAMQPVGTTLYVFGGGWNWQDTGAGTRIRQIGVPDSWIEFFQAQNIYYTFKSQDYADGDNPENMDPKNSYYPYYGFNEYAYAGVDCSAYIAWALYNTINKKNGNEAYLTNSRRFANSLAERKWGTITNEVKKPENRAESEYLPGDIFSIDGHVWICIGTMDDGSLVILHSTPSLSYASMPGGGPQIGAIGDSLNCDAYKLASRYMQTYYPDWSRRYPVALKDYETMTNVEGEDTGKFSWDLSGKGLLKDPDGYVKMTAEEILADLFGEN